MAELTCGDVRDAAAGYALGVADDDTRSGVSLHVQTCRACREEVARAQTSAVWLLDLSAHRDEDWDDYAVEQRSRRRHNLRRVAAVATVTLLVAGSAFGGAIRVVGLTPSGSHPTTPLYRDGIVVGDVDVESGKTPLLRLAVTGLDVDGPLSVEMVSSGGTTRHLGSFELHGGTGYWAGTVSSAFSSAAVLVLADSAGGVVASTSGP